MSNYPALLGNSPLFEEKIDIVRPVLPRYGEMCDQVQAILQSGRMTKGHHLEEFEEMVASHLNAKHAVGVSSCTTGLMLTYQALGLEGDVVVPSFTFMATVSALVWAGVRPVFADVDLATANLSPEAAEEAITPQTSAIVAVHNFGNPADIAGLQEVADRHGLRLIFDAAHGFGSLYQGSPLGTQWDAHVYSMTPTKLLIAGEGGVVVTNDDALAQRVRIGREYGNGGNYDSAFAGINARLPEFNALVGQHSLLNLEAAARHRNLLANIYKERLGNIPGIGFQEVRPGNRTSYKDFSITINPNAFGLTRDELALTLAAENIETRKYYSPPVHRQYAYCRYSSPADVLPNTETLSAQSISLPIWSNMEMPVVSNICAAVERTYQFAEDVKSMLNQKVMTY